jgi:hypothetical protein
MTKKSLFPRAFAAALVVGAFACAGLGQSGSEGTPGDANSGGNGAGGGNGAVTVPCPCEVGGVVLKAAVLERDAQDVTLEIQEIIRGDSAFDSGSIVEVAWDGGLPCYAGETDVEVGDTALVTYRNSAACSEPMGTAGASQTSSDCIDEDSPGFEVRLTRWEDEILFAESDKGQILVPADELSNLWQSDTCFSDYGDWSELLDRAP